MSKRETYPGKVIESLDELRLALMQPSIYWRGKSTPSAWLTSMQFGAVLQMLHARLLRWSVKAASQNGGKSARGPLGPTSAWR